MQLFLITRTTIKKGNSRGKIPLPLNLNKPFKPRTRSSDAELARLQQQYGADEGRSGISHKIFRCTVDFHSKFKCSQTECIEVIEDFTVSRIFISNLFCVVLVNTIPFPRTATLKHLSHNDTTVYV